MATLAKNDRVIERVKPTARRTAYTIKGADGLRLVVHPSRRKVWYSVLPRSKGKQQRWHEIGQYSDHDDGWTLTRAIDENKRVQAKASTGIDPTAPTTFGELFQAWLAEHAK